MAKTKRTVEEVNVAAASNDSKLITQSKLNRFATKFLDKIKARYDGTFKDASITQNTDPNKKITFTKVDGNTKEIDLVDYARLTDKNEFKQDVSADNVVVLNNRHIGTLFDYTSQERSLGFRQLTTNSFSDGYVDHIKIYMRNNISSGTNSTWFVWAIKKGENGKNGDRVVEVIHSSKQLSVNSITENSTEKKFVKIPINKSFENDIYFIVRCTTHEVEVVKEIKSEYSEDVVNMSRNQPPMTQGELIDWSTNVNNNNTAVMQLFGRESISSLHNKINKLNSDSGLYVKHSETTNTGGTTNADKVVKLDSSGKLNKDMLPSIAINEYFQIEQFTHEKLNEIKAQFENGDVVVVTGDGDNKGKRFLCVNKQDNIDDLRKCFIELNSKDGSVVSVNGKSGEVVLDLVATENSLKLTIGNGTGAAVEKIIDIITDDEIDTIINNLQD